MEGEFKVAARLFMLLEGIEDLLSEHNGETSSDLLIDICKMRHSYLEHNGKCWQKVEEDANEENADA